VTSEVVGRGSPLELSPVLADVLQGIRLEHAAPISLPTAVWHKYGDVFLPGDSGEEIGQETELRG